LRTPAVAHAYLVGCFALSDYSVLGPSQLFQLVAFLLTHLDSFHPSALRLSRGTFYFGQLGTFHFGATRGMRTPNNRTGQIFRMAAQSLHRSQTPMGDYLRRLKGKLGPAGATTAAARKIATLFYTLVSRQVEYDPSVWAKLDQRREKRLDATLHSQAAQRGKLVPLKTAA
jgi:hypothetical protein